MPPAWLSSSPVMVPVRSTHPGFVGALHPLGVESRALLPPQPPPHRQAPLYFPPNLHMPSPAPPLWICMEIFPPLHKEKSLHPLPSSGCRIWPKASTHPWDPAQGMLPAVLATTTFAQLKNSNLRNMVLNLSLM